MAEAVYSCIRRPHSLRYIMLPLRGILFQNIAYAAKLFAVFIIKTKIV